MADLTNAEYQKIYLGTKITVNSAPATKVHTPSFYTPYFRVYLFIFLF
jgi:hypothetical protein